MTTAYAIKGPDGEFRLNGIAADVHSAWIAFNPSCESTGLADRLQATGYTCVPVEVTERTEPVQSQG